MMKEIEAIISGRVQMVMYRDFAQRKARKMNITGVVENLKDGTVRVTAQGSEAQLKRYVEHLERGPMFASVKNVAVMWREPTRTFSDFSIVY